MSTSRVFAAVLAALALGLLAQKSAADTATVTVAGGCFWCVEADFEKVQGVDEVVSGYTGGDVPDPTYREVVGGGTGHYEAARIRYDPEEITRPQLYDLFFRSIDPFDAGGQFCDRGDSYRSAIFVGGAAARADAEAAKRRAEEELGREVVTPILELSDFYRAEDYHQDYYKSDERLAVSSVGVAVPKKIAYQRYRDRCGRDARVREIWGDDAPFAGG
ncbi:peptide-methionine (S)-S-oxide reductase [Rhodosalinus sediminis]|uniref:Peptide methionine sulfoxide reductase MsrA n=1 Tax=Rhodosalinus sediminis TaxID=1940533 RepID=A0A3D9BWC4_9RHOB|nr:peptide-methionine (S)-S-oxide reductase MsrA [Rhodosalinus sediminis]REC57742.1 peptide-methionine (S)-S-oxide reductase [Rhodosalinus sediminis]